MGAVALLANSADMTKWSQHSQAITAVFQVAPKNLTGVDTQKYNYWQSMFQAGIYFKDGTVSFLWL